MSGLFRALTEGKSADECIEAYLAAREAEVKDRRSKFAAFGMPADCKCPASRVFHAASRLEHHSRAPLTPEQVHALTTTPDPKRYLGAQSIALPQNLPPIDVPLELAVRRRQSIRSFSREPLSLTQLSRLLALACGITEPDVVPPRRAAPSAGALYAVETYTLVFAVDGLMPGLYHYDALVHEVEHVRPLRGMEELRPTLPEGLWGLTPALAVVLTARFNRIQTKYLERGYRFVLMESGHILQNALLVACALGLGAVPVGGFVDDELDRIMGVDGQDEASLYLALVGPIHSEEPRALRSQ